MKKIIRKKWKLLSRSIINRHNKENKESFTCTESNFCLKK